MDETKFTLGIISKQILDFSQDSGAFQTPYRHNPDNLQTNPKTPATVVDQDGQSETLNDSLTASKG